MKFTNPNARIFVPDAKPIGNACDRITHLGIGAHQDDLEFMALHGILACYDSDSEWFGGVTCTNGEGSPRSGPYGDFTNAQMLAVRAEEQELAARIGRYGVMIQLDYSDDADGGAANRKKSPIKEDLKTILQATQPRVIYTHNLADKHQTHVGVAVAVIESLRELAADWRPQAVYGCEVWRGLDWLSDEEKILHDVSDRENLAVALSGVFDSQIAGGKRYDLATLGRRRANATFANPFATDQSQMLSLAMDLTPLVEDCSLDLIDYVTGSIRRFEHQVRQALSKPSAKESNS